MSAQPVNITVPAEIADAIKARVASGQFANETEVIREGLRTLSERDAAVEHWLGTAVAAEIARDDAHPEERLSVDEVRSRFAAKFADHS